MFFDGQWMNIDMDKIVDMAGLARYQVYIEKRGGVEVLIRFIGDYGVAFVNTQGHFVEYAKDLARAAKISGSHITIVTDSDCAGIKNPDFHHLRLYKPRSDCSLSLHQLRQWF